MEDIVFEETATGDILAIPRRFKSYEVTGTIGRGSKAVVISLNDIHTKEKFAAKIIRLRECDTESVQLHQREFRQCMRMSSPYLVKCIDIVYMDELICLVMEYCNGGNLMQLSTNNQPVVQSHWRRMFTQLCLGIEYLHKRGMAHRNLKLENILLDDNYNCKLCDYGLTCEVNPSTCLSVTPCGRSRFVSPEMIRGVPHCAKQSDMWALGITVYAAVTGSFPWKSQSVMGVYNEILKGYIDTSMLVREMEEIVMRCCDPKPETRATIDEVMRMSCLKLPAKKDARLRPQRSSPSPRGNAILGPEIIMKGRYIIHNSIESGKMSISEKPSPFARNAFVF